VLGVLAGLAVWGIATLAFGVDVRQPAFGAGSQALDMTAAPIVLAGVVGGLAAWLVLALLERITRHARGVWRVLATLALVASLGGPLSGHGVGVASQLVLVLMHLVVGAVLIVLLPRTSPPVRWPSDSSERQ
jgi:hypothetical protein